MELGKRKKEILDILAKPWANSISQTDLSNILEITQPTTQQHLEELEEMGLISIDSAPSNSDIKELTREGYQAREKGVGPEKPISEEKLDISLHNLIIKFKINNFQDLEDGWIERAMCSRPVRYEYDHTNDSYRVFTEDFKFRITSRHVFVMLEDFQGSEPNNLKNRALVQSFRARDWLQDNSPVNVESRPSDLEIWINRQHLSIIGHPFAEYIQDHSELSLSDISIYDSDGTERLWLDSSNGPELEAGNAPGENRAHAEEDIDHLKDTLRWRIENKDKSEALREVPDRVDKLENEVEELKAEIKKKENGLDHLNITSKWRDRWGNVMGWASELGGPVKLIDRAEI